jgi:hypothetical protein|tara:strand:- start:192 stop:398 length:207 start_codon:yes stop_codon:yes gene_type:complete
MIASRIAMGIPTLGIERAKAAGIPVKKAHASTLNKNKLSRLDQSKENQLPTAVDPINVSRWEMTAKMV